jgi:hypothetical protein
MFTEKYVRPNAKIVSTVDQWKIYRDGNELFAIYSKPSQDVHRHTGWVSSVSEIKNKYIVKKVLREMHRLFEDMNGQVEPIEGQVELESNDDGANDVTGSRDDEFEGVDEGTSSTQVKLIRDMTFEEAVRNMKKLAIKINRGSMVDGGGTNFKSATVRTKDVEDFEEYVGRTNGEIYDIDVIKEGFSRVRYFEGDK